MNKIKLFVIASIVALFLGISISAEARVLDIIVGGSNAGLECKTDEECGPNRFCNQEQYYCVACNVPMYEWTGTECKCPADRPVETEDDTCVQCLDLTDCKGSEMFCNTNSNTCAECKAPKEWKDNACVCPVGSHAVGDTCECNKPNSDIMNMCMCTLTPTSCANTDLNLSECICCPASAPVNEGAECKSCAAIDPSKPVWDSAAKTCVECLSNTNCPTNRPICKIDTNTCVQCVETNNCAVNQYCNNMTCSTCPSNQVRPAGEQNCRCPDNLPVWNATSQKCEACPAAKPIWDTVQKKCVECQKNADCKGPNNICNLTTNTCICPNNGTLSGGRCIIIIPDSTFSRDYGRNRPGLGTVRRNIGPYPRAYDLYATGDADDNLHIYLNANPPANGATWAGGLAGTNHAGAKGGFCNRYLGTIPANTVAHLVVSSHTGHVAWSAGSCGRRIWLQ